MAQKDPATPAVADVPEVAPPIAQARGAQGLAPWPLIDRFPILAGQQLSLSYFAAAARTALTGYRQNLIDVLDEMLEKEPHGYSVLWKRILGVAGARLEITPPELAEDDPDRELAEEIAQECRQQIADIPFFRQHLAALCWAIYYALTAEEIHWDRKPDGGWRVARLSFVHSRRLSYPDQQNWDLYIWDQGQVLGYQAFGIAPTNAGGWGLRIADYPLKFIVHAPQLRGDYPTREGLGRQLGEWFILKRLGARSGAQYLERFGKPWPEASYATQNDGKPREASDEDIDAARAAVSALGAGSLSGYTHPDSIKLGLLTPDSNGGTTKLTYEHWIQLCNSEISKPVVGNTLTTEVGQTGGNRALGEVQEREETKILKYDAQAICDSLREFLIKAIVRLNYGAERLRLAPLMTLHVEEPDPMALMELAEKGAKNNIAVDGDKIAADVGLPVVPVGANPRKVRRMVPLDITAPALIDPDLLAVPPANDQQTTNTKPGAQPKAADPDEIPRDDAAE